jgi:AcrR family transcriptional regulator
MSVAQESPRGVRLPRQARRAQLLTAAREVFVAQGYHAAAMDDIAERAGVSKPVLYQHFPGKLDLYLALLDAGREQLVAAVKQALETTTVNKDRVTQVVAAYFDFVAHEAGAFRLIFESDLTNDPQVRQRVDDTNADCARLICQVIEDDTGLGHDESLMLAFGLTGLAQTTARHWLREDSRLPKGDAAALVARLSWRGISGVPRQS